MNFGEDEVNADILNKFVTTINGKEGTGSHLVTIPPGPHLSDALVSSPIVQVSFSSFLCVLDQPCNRVRMEVVLLEVDQELDLNLGLIQMMILN